MKVYGKVTFINKDGNEETKVFDQRTPKGNLMDLETFMRHASYNVVEILGASVQIQNEYISIQTDREVNAIKQAISGLLWGLANEL